MGCVYHGSSNKIQSECDPGPIYVVQRLWDPGGPSFMPRSCFIVDLETLGKLKCYLDYIHLLALLSHPSLVILVPKLHPGNLDNMGASGTHLD